MVELVAVIACLASRVACSLRVSKAPGQVSSVLVSHSHVCLSPHWRHPLTMPWSGHLSVLIVNMATGAMPIVQQVFKGCCLQHATTGLGKQAVALKVSKLEWQSAAKHMQQGVTCFALLVQLGPLGSLQPTADICI